MGAVGARHVLGHGGRSAVAAAGVGRHASVLEEDLDGRGGVADLDLLSDQLVGHAVEVAVELDVVVDVDAAELPAREDVARGRRGPQGGAVELLVEGAAADAELLQRPVVERVEEDADRPVQGADLEEGLVAEPGEYPALDQEDTVLCGGLVPRFPRPRGHDDGAVVVGEVLVGPVHVGLVAAGARDRALELVGNPQGGRAPEVLDHVDVGVDPVRQLLGRGRLGVGEAARPEHGDEQLDLPQLPRLPVDQGRPLPGEVDERLLAGAVDLPHRRPQPPRPLPVDPAELGVAVAVGVDPGVLLPQELQRDAGALQLPVDVRTVGPDPVPHRGGAGGTAGLRAPRRPGRPAAASRTRIPPPAADSG